MGKREGFDNHFSLSRHRWDAVFLILASTVAVSPVLQLAGLAGGNLLSLVALFFLMVSRIKLTQSIVFTGCLLALCCFILYCLHWSSRLFSVYFSFLALLFSVVLLVWSGDGRRLFASIQCSFINISRQLSYARISRVVLILVVFFGLLALINSLYWNALSFKVIIYAMMIMISVSFMQVENFKLFTVYLSFIHMAMLVGCIIGFVYTINGGDALFSVINEDGRSNGFYLSTFSNTYFNGFIRPSGLYDEPGALSFFICINVALREYFGLPRRLTWQLIALGLVTSSLAHLIFLLFFILHVYRKNVLYLSRFFLIASLSFFVLLSFDSPVSSLYDGLSARLSIVDGKLVGDNRSFLITNALGYLDPRVFLFGLDGNCIVGDPLCREGMYLKYGENPFTPLVHYGIFLSLIYYLGLTGFVYLAVKHKSYLALAVALLLLQRPYIFNYGYSAIIIIYFYLLVYSKMGRKRTIIERGSVDDSTSHKLPT